MDFPTLLVFMVVLVHGVLPTESLTWPGGTYGLPKPKRGCPSGWSEGYRYQDTENSNPRNEWSPALDLSGFWSKTTLKHYFCMKTQTRSWERRWPAGSYCVYKKGSCPSGFQSGYVFWDDQDWSNRNKAGGVRPDGEYSRNTRLDFCCRNDAASSRPISLPNQKDFMLFSRYDSCQEVYGMTVEKQWFVWDTENTNNKDSDAGKHPFQGDLRGSSNIKLNFCFYQRLKPWPDGTYGLPKPLSGCPPHWEDGYRYHDTEDVAPSNRWSDNQHMNGTRSRSSIRHEFCIKTTPNLYPSSFKPESMEWPAGKYCIYRKGGTCPTGFENSYIFWDDEDFVNRNSHGGALPDGLYGTDTLLRFCCRQDGLSSRGITLPTTKYFYLFTPVSTCQKVNGMTVTKEWIYWDSQDTINLDMQSSSIHPYEGVTRDFHGGISLTFCYYERP